jgi:2-polyprenyl-6-methoxyphenol hydroxylase-like FAD-dependent oxidoreductase
MMILTSITWSRDLSAKLLANNSADFVSESVQSAKKPSSVKRLVNPALIDSVFTTREYAFDSHKLRDVMLQRLSAANVTIVTDAVVEIVRTSGDGLELVTTISGQSETSYADHLLIVPIHASITY